MQKKFLKNNFFVILFIVAGIMVMVVAGYTGIFITRLSDYFSDSIDQRMRFVSRAASGLVTPEELAELTVPEDIQKPIFDELRQRLIDFGYKAEVKFVYLMWPLPGGRYQIIVDNDLTEETENLTSPPRDAEAAFSDVMAGKTIVTGLGEYTDGPGDTGLLTSYSPIFDHDGQVIAAAGIDIDDEKILETRNQILILSFITAVSTCLVIAIGILSFYISRKKQEAFLNRIRQQELMSQLSRSFISAEDATTLIKAALRITGEFLGADRIVIGIPENEIEIAHIAYAWAGTSLDIDSAEIPDETDDINHLAKNIFPQDQPAFVSTIFCGDTRKETRYEQLILVGTRAFIWAPLYVEGRYWAVLSVDTFTPHNWTQSDRQLVSLVSSVIAGAIERNLRDKERDAARLVAEQASKAKTEFLANMSHEMRTPMNAIIGMTSIARNSGDAEKKEYCLAKIENASTHLLGVINDILDMSKIEANRFELSPIEFNFEKMLEKTVSVINFKTEEKNQVFNLNYDKNIPAVLTGDDQRLAQVITNLLSNAVKFTPEKGTITLEAKLEKREVGGNFSDDDCIIRVSVTDTGIGISHEQQAKLFNAFEQADSGTSRQFGGTGLGLAISKNIIEKMGGSIHIESEPGKGSAFIFTVRLQEAAASLESIAEDSRSDETEVKVEDITNCFKDMRIILAEDVDINREIMLSLLEPTSLTIDCAENGAKAVKLYKQSPDGYDMIFMDLQMPEVDGLEATRQIRAFESGRAKRIPIIAMTANVFKEDVEMCMEAGMNGHLGKPLNFNEVLAKLRFYQGYKNR